VRGDDEDDYLPGIRATTRKKDDAEEEARKPVTKRVFMSFCQYEPTDYTQYLVAAKLSTCI
jgi:hypothetical protein